MEGIPRYEHMAKLIHRKTVLSFLTIFDKRYIDQHKSLLFCFVGFCGVCSGVALAEFQRVAMFGKNRHLF